MENYTNIVIVFAVIFILCISVKELFTGDWQCLDGINTPVREWQGNIECMSKNGRDCMWQNTSKACNNLVVNVPKGIKPLSCGEMSQKVWGTSGYKDKNHWCNKTKEQFFKQKMNQHPVGPWKCLERINVPVRKNQNGEVECMSKNHRDCLWQKDFTGCYGMIVEPPKDLKPLSCGAMSKRIWGTTGYNDKNHWCTKAKSLLENSENCSLPTACY